MSMMISTDTRAIVLRTARNAIEAQLDDRPLSLPTLTQAPHVSGVFVTLRVSGSLRGCIGFLELRGGLLETVAEAARYAATQDVRFRPLTRKELQQCRIEVTLLGAPERIMDAEEFTLGRHGLIIEYDGNRGLLLPQVPVERGWNRTEFLSALCQKAQLSDSCWTHPDATLFRFEGLPISEESAAPMERESSG
ncbi:MAG: AmmeMemoRadiSam system protein A [Bacteroidetes bacterium]|nr:AmmeMemoRadiSam system protein A [Bacteroidota bacterium]